jgi:hypothetical protein
VIPIHWAALMAMDRAIHQEKGIEGYQEKEYCLTTFG